MKQAATQTGSDMNSLPCIRTLVVDDHPVVRLGLRSLHRHDVTIEVVGDASTAADTLIKIEQLHPDVVLLDLALPDGNGSELCTQIKARWPKTRVLIFSCYNEEKFVLAAMHAGADGYLLKGTRMIKIVEGIHAVMQGGACFDANVTRHLLDHVRDRSASNPLARLTSLEMRVLALVAEGKTDKEVAGALDVKPKTVRNCLDHSFKKLKVNTRTRAAMLFAQYHSPQSPVRSR